MIKEASALTKIPKKNFFTIQVLRQGKEIFREDFPNGITDEGLHYLQNVGFKGSGTQAQISAWYIGLIDNSGYSAVAAGDTAAQINGTNGWDEFTSYSGSNRLAWTPGVATSRAITNSTTVDFSITGTGTLKGGFLSSGQAKSATTGILFATAILGSTVPVVNGDTVKITYTISG